MPYICVVDDKAILRESLEEALTRDDHTVRCFADPVEALREIKTERFDLILADLKMPRMDGLTLIREVRASGYDSPIIMMTAFATVSTAVEAMKLGAFDYIQKPFDPAALSVVIERALEYARLRRENETLRRNVEDLAAHKAMVGSGGAMTDLQDELVRIAASHDTVLITGESGSGKELVAALIHRNSQRAGQPMMCLNCAALSPNLLESELFGHERGAFTGADRVRKGRFELADGGTLLLDEISEMAVELQAKLLRVLQEGQFERVGSSVSRRADVRVIATTNRDLDDWVTQKRFRADLFYRLNVLPVRVPPLRERSEDIRELTEHFLDQVAGGRAAERLRIDPAALDLLVSYDWPGNVRELENLCRRAATLCRSGTITASLISPWLRSNTPSMDTMGALRPGSMLADMERRLIEKILDQFNGHRAKSAKALGMGVRTLGMKLKQWRDEATANEHRHPVAVGVGT